MHSQQPSQDPPADRVLRIQALLNTHLAPKMSFFARSMPETTFTLRMRDSSCVTKKESAFSVYAPREDLEQSSSGKAYLNAAVRSIWVQSELLRVQ